MDILYLSELIGQAIADLRFHFISEDECGGQTSHSYIKLADNRIIFIPKWDDDYYLELRQVNIEFLQKRFDTGNTIQEKNKSYFVGQKIVDFFFSYYINEDDFDHSSAYIKSPYIKSAYIKLTNGYYLTENNFEPVGLTNIDLIMLDEEQFQKEQNKPGVDTRSFLKTKNVCNIIACNRPVIYPGEYRSLPHGLTGH